MVGVGAGFKPRTEQPTPAGTAALLVAQGRSEWCSGWWWKWWQCGQAQASH